MTMNKYELTIIASGLDPAADDFYDRFYEAGCDDATVAFVKGLIVLEFEREAKNFAHALASAITDVKKAGATVEHVEPDYLVSLSDIAKRCKLSKAAISLYAKEERGENFPAPVARLTTESPLWDWVEVAQWLYHEEKALDLEDVVQARLVRDTTLALSKSQGKSEPTKFAKKILETA
jgi:hypothetical protein